MCCAREIAEQLSQDEKRCLAALCSGSDGRDIPFSQAEKLLSLGLAELCQGGLDPTGTGRRVAQLAGA